MPAPVKDMKFALNHSINHRGPVAAYWSAMGGKVRSIYGESVTAPTAKKAGGEALKIADATRRDG